MANKIKKGDTVKVITGKDKDREGKVLSVDMKNHKVLVEGVNMVTKHTKPSAQNQQGGIVSKEAPIDISNVMYSAKHCYYYSGVTAKVQPQISKDFSGCPLGQLF